MPVVLLHRIANLQKRQGIARAAISFQASDMFRKKLSHGFLLPPCPHLLCQSRSREILVLGFHLDNVVCQFPTFLGNQLFDIKFVRAILLRLIFLEVPELGQNRYTKADKLPFSAFIDTNHQRMRSVSQSF